MGRNDNLQFQAVRYLAEERLAQANERIRLKGGDIRYVLYENLDGTFSINVGRDYKGADGYVNYKYLYSVLSDIDVYSAYYCACGIKDATTIDYQ